MSNVKKLFVAMQNPKFGGCVAATLFAAFIAVMANDTTTQFAAMLISFLLFMASVVIYNTVN